ncbi:phage tail protein [Pediococcus pentosaceus]|uniref:phage tail protein n=1 Tax=Pediococcus pentosaceus TaxID=1255 RepID=UPI003462B783
MIKFYNEKGEACFGQATVTRSTGVNGSASISGTIFDGQEVLTKIDRGWWFKFEDDKYVVTYKKLNDNDKTIEFDAVQSFFWDFQKTVFHEQWNGSHEFTAYLEALFKNSGYKYTLDGKVSAFEKENWGYKNKLDLFNDIIQQAEMEFEVYNETIHITKQIGDDLTSIARKGINLSDLVEEMKISDFVTYGKGYGAFKDKDDQSKGRLEVEYRSELAKTYGDLEMDPIVDERYTDATSLTNAIKKQVDASYYISVSMNIYDLENAGYPNYQSPQVGDWLLAIDEALNFKRQIRIIKLEEVFDATGKRIGYTTTCGDLSTADQYQNAQGNVNNRIDDITNQIDDVATSANGKNSNYYGDTEPTNPNDGDLWYDTSSSDSDDWIIYQWHNGRWEQITLNPNQITNEINEANTDMQNAIDEAKKAVEDAEGKVDDFGDSLTIIQGDITQAKSDAANALNNVTVIDSKLTQLSDTTTARLDTLDNGYQQVLTDTSGMKTQITDIAGELNSKVSNDVYQSDKTQTADLISETVQKIDDLTIGGTNLIKNSKFDDKMNGWRNWCPQGMGTSTVEINPTGGGGDWPRQAIYLAKIVNTETDKNNQFGIAQDNVPVEPNTEYVLQLFNDGSAPITVQHGSGTGDPYVSQVVSDHKAVWKFKTPTDIYNTNIYIGFNSGQSGTAWISLTKLEKGNKPTDWSLSPFDTATSAELNIINDAVQLKANSADVTSQINVAVQGVQAKVDSEVSGLESTITEMAGTVQILNTTSGTKNLVHNSTFGNLVNGFPKDWTKSGGDEPGYFSKHPNSSYQGVGSIGVNTSTNLGWVMFAQSNPMPLAVDNDPSNPKNIYSASMEVLVYNDAGKNDGRVHVVLAFFDANKKRIESNIKGVWSKRAKELNGTWELVQINGFKPVAEAKYVAIQAFAYADPTHAMVNQPMINVGDKVAPYRPDEVNQSDITASIDNIHLGVKNADGSTATFNMNSSTILLDAGKIMINGTTSIKDATISSAKIASLSADKITAGTLNASKVNVFNLNAANIVTGTIKGANLSINLNTGEVIFQHGHIYNTTGSFDMNIDEGTLKIFNSAKDSGIQMGKGKVLFTESTVWNESNPGYGQIEFGGVENLLKQGMSIVGNHVLTLRTVDASDNWVSDSSEGAAIELFNADYNSSQNGVSVGIRGEQAIKITSGDLGLSTPHIIVNENKTNAIGMLGSSIDLESSLGLMESGGDFHLSNDGKARVWSSAINLRTYSNSSNVYVTEYGTLGRSTSASKYKLNITKLTDADQAHALLSINAKTWYDKKDMNNIADEMSTGLEQSADHPKIKPYLGFIAEDFANAGLEILVSRDKNGELESINYDRISALEHLNVQELFSRVLQLEKEVHELRSETK